MQTKVRHTKRRGNRRYGLSRCTATAILALAVVATAGAQEAGRRLPDGSTEAAEDLRRYTVELIVFTYGPSASAGTEVFIPEATGDALPEQTADGTLPLSALDEPVPTVTEGPGAEDRDAVPEYGDLMPAFPDEDLEELIAADTIGLRVLTPDELTMADVHDKLVRLDAYTPVMWAGWTQTTLEEQDTPSIRLRRLGNIPLQFQGNLKLYLSRYLHLVIDIGMDAETGLPGSATALQNDYRSGSMFAPEPPLVRYRIMEDRIVKSGDIRYFDHPKFGVLAKVTRAENMEPEPTEIDFFVAPGEVPPPLD